MTRGAAAGGRLTVLHCIYDDPGNPWVGGGGAERLRELYTRLGDAVDVTVLTGNYPGASAGVVGGVRYRRAGGPTPYAWSRASYGAAATRALHRDRYDVAVVDVSPYTPIVVPRGRPVAVAACMLVGPHAAARWGPVRGGMVAWAERQWLRGSRHVCSTTATLAGELAPLVRADARIDVVGSGVDPAFFAVRRQRGGDAVRPPHTGDLPPDELLYYGRFDVHQKGLDVLLDAMPLVLARRPGTRLRCAGRGRDAGRLRALVAARGLADHVVVEEQVSRARVLALLASAPLLVGPSRFEAAPLVYMEAMAAGVPVVATDVGAVAELCSGGDAGPALVPFGDAAALASAIVALLDDAPRRRRMEAAGRVAARAWSWERCARDHLDFLHRVAACAT